MTKLYEANNHILIRAGYDNPVLHRHMAAHIIISIGGEMCITSGDAEYLCHGVVIPSGIPHKVNTYGNAALVFLYDCTTDIAKQIQSIRRISEECCQKIVASYADIECECTADNYYRFVEVVLLQLGLAGTTSRVKDERIISAMPRLSFFRHACTSKGFSPKLLSINRPPSAASPCNTAKVSVPER